jgi:hypothetical protein
LHMLEQAQQQSQRLLEAPRSVPAPSAPAPLVRAPEDTAPPARVVSPGREPFPTRGAYDPDAAYARVEALQAQGQSFRQIAAQLTAEGIPTHRGGPWGQSSVRYLLKTYGQ